MLVAKLTTARAEAMQGHKGLEGAKRSVSGGSQERQREQPLRRAPVEMRPSRTEPKRTRGWGQS